MNRIIEKGVWVLDRKSEKLREELEKLRGLPFADDDTVAEGGNWYSLTAPVKRGEDFICIFNSEELVEKRIKNVTFFVIQSAYNAEKFSDLVDQCNPINKTPETYVAEMSAIYFELERCISESVKPNGEAAAAIASDEQYGNLSAQEATLAREWVQSNRMKLQSLKMEAFSMLFEFRKENPGTALPDALEIQLEREQEMLSEPGDEVLADILPKVPIKAMEAELEQYQVEAVTPDGSLLEALCDFHQKTSAWCEHLNEMEYHRQLRAISDDFEDYEQHLMRFNRLEEGLETLRVRAQELISRVYHTVFLGTVPQHVLDISFQVVIDQILNKVRLLDYRAMDAEKYQRVFERALELQGQDAYLQLDQLFKELHALPRQSQLIQALSEWEQNLDREVFMEKQSYIVENEFQLQELLDQVRGELRERMTEERIDSRRLRFDVFSLSDCFVGNLETALEALLRTVPLLASDSDGEMLMEQLQALEGQVIEAQRVTRPGGEAFRKLRDLERSKLMPTTFLGDLRKDIEENFEDLNTLLARLNEESKKLRHLQNRFGGEHDTGLFSLSINVYDLEQLKKIYDFVENITMMDLKRFGLVYNHKTAMMEDLFKRALNNDPSVPENIASTVNRRVYKAFKDSKNISMDLKILILWEIPEMLESECELLVRTLNFVDHEKIEKKAIYQGLRQILAKAEGANPTTRTYLQRIWNHHLKRINEFQPSHYQQNYILNRRKLMESTAPFVAKINS